jgi:pimeloyl-ACP methyl ester carboxylesterase
MLSAGVYGCGMPESASTPASTPDPTSPATSASPTLAGASGDFAGVVDIGGGRGLYLECHGSGGPTVIFQSGFGNAGDIWYQTRTKFPAVALAVSDSARVCSYDRPGSYISSELVGDEVVPADSVTDYGRARGTAVAERPSTAGAVVEDLHALLTGARVSPPYVLVGHSLGGLFTQLYVRSFPDEVTGVVLVDSTNRYAFDAMPPRLAAVARQSFASPASLIPGYVNEGYDIDRSFDELSRAKPFPSVPVVVLSAGQAQEQPDPLPPGVTAKDWAAYTPAWRRAQRELAASIPGAKHITVDSPHYINTIRPDAVIDAIQQIRR